MQRIFALFITAVVLAGCATTPDEPDLPPFTLTGGGIDPSISRLSIDFGRAQVGVIDTVTRLLKTGPVEVTTVTECGVGPMTIARWENGLSLNFIEEDFRGWVSSDPSLPVDGGFSRDRPGWTCPRSAFRSHRLATSSTSAR
jgi:hypothetical protein